MPVKDCVKVSFRWIYYITGWIYFMFCDFYCFCLRGGATVQDDCTFSNGDREGFISIGWWHPKQLSNMISLIILCVHAFACPYTWFRKKKFGKSQPNRINTAPAPACLCGKRFPEIVVFEMEQKYRHIHTFWYCSGNKFEICLQANRIVGRLNEPSWKIYTNQLFENLYIWENISHIGSRRDRGA